MIDLSIICGLLAAVFAYRAYRFGLPCWFRHSWGKWQKRFIYQYRDCSRCGFTQERVQ
jgi:hypothetical protein